MIGKWAGAMVMAGTVIGAMTGAATGTARGQTADADDARRMVSIFGPRTRQYVHISSGSIYAKPVWQVPISESTPTALNPHLEYAQQKWYAERALFEAYQSGGFPLTVVRPSHTYDDANPPLPGGWTAVERIARGLKSWRP